MITQQTIEKVFETARVEEVVGEFVQLKKSGSNFKGLSPFTEERTPSFMVSPVKQIWKDFSSGKGGNAISFLMEHEHYSYPEAIRWLAKKYNIEIEETEQSDEEKEQVSERESMFLVTNFAKEYFYDVLYNTPEGKAIGLTYFKERGFREQTIKKFELGYAIDQWDNFTKTALEKGYNLKYLEKTGLTVVKENKQFDRFKARVLFPIHSISGRVLGFGGRILTNNKKVAKYINSPESEIYHKSKVLYGIYQAKKEIAKQDNCFLVEGYTDVISFHQSGIENVVASSGTALTPDQIRLINRLTKNITVLFDGDDAGIRASIRGIDLILEQGMNVKVVSFPEGEDPDSFAKLNSSDELKTYLKENALDFIAFKVSLLLKDAADDPIKKASLIRDIVVSISKIPDTIKREVYVQECARVMGVSERVLFSELAQILKKNSKEAIKHYQKEQSLEVVKQVTQPKIDSLYLLEKEIIRILLLYGNQEVDFTDWVEVEDEEGKITLEKEQHTNIVAKELYLHLQEDEIEFTNDVFKQVYYSLIHQLNQNEKIAIEQLVHHKNNNIAQLVTSVLMDEERYILSDWQRKEIFVTETKKVLPKLVTDAILNIRRILIEKKINEILNDIKTQKASADLEEVNNYTSLKKRLFEKLNRVV
ncbi:DNA primase [Tenacibaculum sp. UWU-22]|uniref:DNA primase n=1 Tax=Tenacibaculum sp. UWU-22 TaxID=3234187 RepID=UPI0034DB77E7